MATPNIVRRSLLAGAALTLIAPVAAIADSSLGSGSDFVPAPAVSTQIANADRWFVQFESAPTAAGGDAATIAAEQADFVAEAAAQGVPADVTSEYSTLFNGVAVEAGSEEASLYASLEGVAAVFPVLAVAAPEPESSLSPEMFTAVAMTGADIAQSELGLSGEGVKVAIIDTGIDYDHPDLGGTGTDGDLSFPTDRVVAGWDFVGDAYNADPNSPSYNPVPAPDADPDDCQGHGTHVAGIVGADGEVDGVAPNVQFGAYRVFGCEGSTDTQIILDALERAEADGMDVVNMSLGYAFMTWPDYPTGVASNILVDNGVVVVGSAGNEGEYFTMVTGSPAAGQQVISTASFDNTSMVTDELLIEDEGSSLSVGYLTATGSPAPTPELGTLPIAVPTAADGSPVTNGCAVSATSLEGSIALVQRGDCTFHEKALYAQQSGAEAVIVFNNTTGTINMTVEGTTPITIPAISITEADGDAITAMLTGEAPTGTFTGELMSVDNPTGGLVSDFSSWGLAADLTLKPDLGAPGGSIYSTYPLEKGTYATLSGTSMAAPHVAGAVALMLEANPELTPSEVLARLQNTASPAPFSYLPDLGILDAAHHQGAGLIRVDEAITGTTLIQPGKISAGEGEDGPHSEVLTISNLGEEEVTYSLSFEDAISTNPVYEDGAEATQNNPGFFLFSSQVSFSADTVTVPAGEQVEVTVTIAPDPEAMEGTQYSGYILLADAEGATLSVPYAGMAGDYGALPIFTDYGYGLPALGVLTDCEIVEDYQCVDEDAGFDYAKKNQVYHQGLDMPTLLVHMDNPALSVTVEVYRTNAAGRHIELVEGAHAFTVDRVGRDGGISAWVWDGQITDANGNRVAAQPGNYQMVITAVEADGDGGTQSWQSPTFKITNANQVPGQSGNNGRGNGNGN